MEVNTFQKLTYIYQQQNTMSRKIDYELIKKVLFL